MSVWPELELVSHIVIHVYLLIFPVLGFEVRAYTLSHSTSLVFWGFFFEGFFSGDSFANDLSGLALNRSPDPLPSEKLGL
jgi:hypothetical protein